MFHRLPRAAAPPNQPVNQQKGPTVAMKIEGVPETISRAAYLKMITDIGLDPNNLRSLRFGHNNITAVVFATHPETGQKVINQSPTGDPGYLKHTVIIHVRKDEKEPVK